ncbi:hypothetical protein DMH18_36230 [Streptomyces sp. WAC 06783]|uniref:hypothetical protein n=1 Tax=Streptomyces sp. WAC 06783 TaxID=2203211 RepID=UPI000F747286|nr:hypothetical protein [Streptomyces sp. WAC 06783]RSO03832.1 hypothetical protein DMH18_36230 [Streptomyces sp. WAC 06783]
MFKYLGDEGAKALRGSEKAGEIAGKALQGSVNLSTQVPLVSEMASGKYMSSAKNTASAAALTANHGQSTGS